MDFRDLIEKHKDEGTCLLCGKPVEDGQAVHGLTGAHYECYEAQMAKAEYSFFKLDTLLKRAQKMLDDIE